MKLLYIGCHSILEYDELRIFSEIDNMQLFSNGAYCNPSVIWKTRPPLNFSVNQEDYESWNKHGSTWNSTTFMDRFDIIYFMHCPDLIFDNWEILKNRRIIWRTIGQSSPELESKMQVLMSQNPNLKVVRYSPAERRHRNFAGEDVMIRFGKYPNDYKNWNGEIKEMGAVVQNMSNRGDACGWDIFSNIAKHIPCRLFGHSNQGAGNLWNGRDISYEELLGVYQDYRVYFYAGTKPASYCLNFIEAWMTGIPIIAVGNKLGNGVENLYEINELITHGKNGYCVDSIESIIKLSKLLFENRDLAREISIKGRKSAIEIFDANKIKLQWESFFKSI